jgi:hypothetical protein
VRPILEARCASCHNRGSAAPLMTYEAAADARTGIQMALLAGLVTPSLADAAAPRAEHRALTMLELHTLMTWSAGGAPEAGVRPPHQPHTAHHGGVFFETGGDTVHMELVWQEQRRVRIYLSDAFGEPLAGPPPRVRVVTADQVSAPFVAAATGEYLEARIATQRLPATLQVMVTAPGAAEERSFGFVLSALGTEPFDFTVPPTEIPPTRAAVLDAIGTQVKAAEELVAAGAFGRLYLPATHLRNLLLALPSRPEASIPDRRALEPQLLHALRLAWLIHLSGDVGSPVQTRATMTELRRAVDALAAP